MILNCHFIQLFAVKKKKDMESNTNVINLVFLKKGHSKIKDPGSQGHSTGEQIFIWVDTIDSQQS